MITALSVSTLLSVIESPSGDKYIVNEAMLNNALQCICAKEQSALMHLSEVRTFNAIHLKTRHHDRQSSDNVY
eukprot:12883390-Prorocentrum_lima.AAC.1